MVRMFGQPRVMLDASSLNTQLEFLLGTLEIRAFLYWLIFRSYRQTLLLFVTGSALVVYARRRQGSGHIYEMQHAHGYIRRFLRTTRTVDRGVHAPPRSPDRFLPKTYLSGSPVLLALRNQLTPDP